VERRAWFVKDVMVRYMPKEILPGDLIAGGRFNVQTSLCLDWAEHQAFDNDLLGKNGARARMKWFHDHGYGNAGATSGHLIPDHERALKIGWKGISADLETRYRQLSDGDKRGRKGAQLRAMMTAASEELKSQTAELGMVVEGLVALIGGDGKTERSKGGKAQSTH
jgi:trans-4-hydroxy-L-proline dehydratase